MTLQRRPVLFNANAKDQVHISEACAESAAPFHKQLPGYSHTTLINLDEVAKEVGVQTVRLKDESTRLGLPSFKILGLFRPSSCFALQGGKIVGENTDCRARYGSMSLQKLAGRVRW
ncbi:hypothetical protein F5B22DRAFT_571689 [Xylaria bambusicola]|uniref:uncharacterized protein n=1 Tax=Xylaria bambusicola TaxID=326684 RepID=UPI002007FCBA|nr:uncharacterized protein F5B22DRAFT_571689 [Xylaria bambusicola]KAI0521388.1 hypothetical protein F5B22DRAFT_571689 [Xylaria bambusicola]